MLEREKIYQRVWGYAMAHGDRSVDVFVRKLRQKLEKRSPSWSYIHTHFGIGYRFEPEPAGIVEEELRPAEPSSRPSGRRPSRSRSPLHRSFTRASRRGNRSASIRRARRDARRRRLATALEIRPEEHAALVDGRPLSLTVRELQLLVSLA